MWFDPHWHARDEEQKHKETIERSLQLVEIAGGTAIAAMPNLTRPLISLERCQEYLALADTVDSPVQFYIHIGLTPDLEQVKRAVQASRTEPRIIGMKAYWGRSTGDLSIIHESEQYQVLDTLTQEGFTGVLVSHCEKEGEMRDDLYNPSSPVTWNTLCRPEKAEITSFNDIVRMAEDVKFPGKIHLAHVSTREVVDAINNYNGSLSLSCGITPHHLFLDHSRLNGTSGRWYKCNPPLRSAETQQGLLERFLTGKIPILESDHAPHTEQDKHATVPASGIISGPVWFYVLRHLISLGCSHELIFGTTFQNAVRLYNLNLNPRNSTVNWQKLEEIRSSYPFDPFKGVF